MHASRLTAIYGRCQTDCSLHLSQEAARHGVGATTVGLIFSSFSFLDFFASLAIGSALQQQLLGRRPTLVCGIVVLAGSVEYPCRFISMPVPLPVPIRVLDVPAPLRISRDRAAL